MVQQNTTDDNIRLMLDMEMERLRKEEVLICPHCGHESEVDIDFPPELVTHWGSDGTWHEVWCPNCDKEFMAKEEVRRTFESRHKTEDDS